jgi:hypothetical protein
MEYFTRFNSQFQFQSEILNRNGSEVSVYTIVCIIITIIIIIMTLVTIAWRVLRLRMEETASSYGG